MAEQMANRAVSRRTFVGAAATAMASLALVGGSLDNRLAKADEHPANVIDKEFDPEVDGKWIPSVCWNNCGGMCENKVYVADGVVIRQKTDDTGEDSLSSPQLRSCARGRAHRQDTFGADRLKYPMRRKNWEPHTGGAKELRGIDEWVRISWDEAFEIIADELRHNFEANGPRSLLYGGLSSQFGSLATCANSLGGGFSVSSTMSCGTTCFTSAVMGLPYLGIGEGNDRTDFVNAEYIVLYGCNPAWASPGSYTYFFHEAKKNGTQFVFVGPEYNASAAHFNAKWIRVRPGSDTAFLLAVAYEMFKLDEQDKGSVIDWDFLDRYTVGINGDSMPADAKVDENFYDYLMGAYDGQVKDAEWATKICGTPVEDIRWYAELMRRQNAVTALHSYAPFRANDSDDLQSLFMTIGFMGGHIGKPGHATDCAYHNTVGSPRVPIFTVGGSGAGGTSIPNPITDIVNDAEQWDAVLNGRFNSNGSVLFGAVLPENQVECDIHVILMDESATVNSHLNTARAIEALRKVDFVAATARAYTSQVQYADVILPLVGEWETPGRIRAGVVGYQTFFNREAFIVGTKVCEPMFETQDSTFIGRGLGEKLGLPVDEIWPPVSAQQQFFNQLAGSTLVHPETGEKTTLFSVTQEDIDAMGVEAEPQDGFMPLSEILQTGIYRVKRTPGDVYTYYGYQDFINDPENNPRATPSGKFEIYCQAKADALNAAGRTKDFVWKPYPSYKAPVNGYEDTFEDFENGIKGEYPYQVFNPHYLRRSHTQFDNLPWLRHAFPNPVFISAADAAEKGIADGDWVRIWNRAGQTLRPASVTERMMPGVIALPHGTWVDIDEETGIDKAGTDNMLTEPVTSGCGVAGYNTNIVNFEKYDGVLEADYLLPLRVPTVAE